MLCFPDWVLSQVRFLAERWVTNMERRERKVILIVLRDIDLTATNSAVMMISGEEGNTKMWEKCEMTKQMKNDSNAGLC